MNKSTLTEHYWLHELAEPLPILELPCDAKTPSRSDLNTAASVTFLLGGERTERLRAYAHQYRTTEHTLLLSCQFVLLHKLTGDRDVIVGAAAIPGKPEMQRRDELPFNGPAALPIRIAVDEGMTFANLLKRVEEKWSLAVSSSQLLYEEPMYSNVLEQWLRLSEDLSCSMFQYASDCSFSDLENLASPVPLSVRCCGDECGLALDLVYNTALFRAETIEAYMRYYVHIVEQVLEYPDKAVAAISLLTEREVAEELERCRAPLAACEGERVTAQAQFERQALLHPEAPALVFQGQTITYRELNARANRLARTLREDGVAPDQIVVLIADRSPLLLIGILAILKAGGAYLAIDPSFPEERKQYMLEECGCRLLLLQRGLQGDIRAERIWYLDDESNDYEDEHNVEPTSGADHLAYIIYTSGSTGQPKGIMIEHRGLSHFMDGFASQLPLRRGQRILGLATVSFDIFIVESLLPLALGMTIVLASEEEKNDPSRLSHLLSAERVDVLQLTPSRFKWWTAHTGASEAFNHLELLMIGAEPLTPSIWRALKACLAPAARIFNLYGPTETTVWASAQEVTEEGAPITIGRGLAGTSFLVMNADGQLQPDGVPGELYIGGAGLGRGYMNRPELTEAAFVLVPYEGAGKFYRTGDIVRKLPNGEYIYVGRKDFQVKIRGYRIELGEIEQVLLRYPAIREAVVHAVPVAGEDEQALCAYIVGEEVGGATELRQYLAERLPAYMLPSYIMSLEAIPLTPTGKVDRKSLPHPAAQPGQLLQAETTDADSQGGPQNERENALFDVWENMLGHRSFHRNQSFFDAGGSSIAIIRVCSQLEQAGWKLEVADMFRHLTIAAAAPLMKRLDSAYGEWSLFSGTIEGEVELVKQQHPYIAKAKALSDTEGRAYDSRTLHRSEGFDRNTLEIVMGRLMERHDALRIIYYRHGNEVVQYNQGMFGPLYKLDVSDLPEEGTALSYIEQIVEEANHRRKAWSDWRLEAHLCKGTADEGDYLVLMGDPLVMDAPSWDILLEELIAAYRQAAEATDIRFPLKTNSFQLYAKMSKEQGSDSGLKGDHIAASLQMHNITISLGEHLTGQLLSSFADAGDDGLVENILAHALLQALTEERTGERVHISMDGRSLNTSGLHFSRTIGRMERIRTVSLSTYEFEPDRAVQEIGIAEGDVSSATHGDEVHSASILIQMDKLAAAPQGVDVIHACRQPAGCYAIEAYYSRLGSDIHLVFHYGDHVEPDRIKRLADLALKRIWSVVGWLG